MFLFPERCLWWILNKVLTHDSPQQLEQGQCECSHCHNSLEEEQENEQNEQVPLNTNGIQEEPQQNQILGKYLLI